MAQPLDAYVAEHQANGHQWAGEPAWLSRTRRHALDAFLSLGLPTTRDEEWRFTSVAPIAEQAFALAGTSAPPRVDLAPFEVPGIAGSAVVFVDGRYAPALSNAGALPRGVRVGSLRAALADRSEEIEPHLTRLAPAERDAFTALNTAFLADGAWIQVPAHTVLDRPVHVLFVSTGAAGTRPVMSHPRVLVVIGEDSQAAMVESYAGANGAAGCLTNAVTEIALGENAVLDHYKLQREDVQGYHIGSMHVRAQRSANFSSHSISLGGSLVRNDAIAVLDGEGAECTLNGLYVAGGRRLVDNHTTIDHAKPHCGSREVYKGVLGGRARGVFNGKIIVRPDAQKTDARQTNRALLLSEDARINTKPQLEIFANDVKCTHGAAVGQLDDEAVFYLRSRGLGEAEARRLLIRAFAADVLNHMPLGAIRDGVEEMLLRQLADALPAAA